MKPIPAEVPSNATLDPDEIRSALELVLASTSFRRSERHARFLRFVCETTLNGDGAKLNEYLIAHDVFGRGDDYTPSEDSIVRRQAHSLRQKLQEYYTSEGARASIRVELPIGRYIPHFVRLPDAAEIPAVQAATVPIADEPKAAPRWSLPAKIAAGAICAIGVFAAGWIIGHTNSAPRAGTIPISPAMAALWAPWLANGGDALICFSSPLTTVVKQYPTPLAPNIVPLRLSVNAEQDRYLRESLDLPSGGFIYLSPALTQSKMGEAVGSIALVRFLTSLGIPSSATQSRLMSWEDFRAHNLILLGHDEANRWLDPILSKLPIRMGTSPGDKTRRIINTAPEPGGQSEYYIKYPLPKGQSSDDYALVSMIGGIDGKHQLLLVNGVNSEGTQMAMEFMSDPAAMESLLTELRRKSPNHQGPWHFQLVLRTEVRDKIPTRAELLVVKVL